MLFTPTPEQKVSALIHAIDADVVLIDTLADQTVQALAMEKARLIALNKMTIHITKMIEDLVSTGRGDSLLFDEAIRENMESTETKLAELIHEDQQRKESAVSDRRLRGANKASVLLGYDEAISCTQLLAHSVQELRWAAMEYDADASPVSAKEYTDVKKLIADLEV